MSEYPVLRLQYKYHTCSISQPRLHSLFIRIFSTSRATDLDQVIQTMLLDDVRQRIQNIENRLNQIISNQQRIYEKLSDIQQTASYISRQMNSIELSLNEQIRNSQEQTEQLKMIKTNTEISNYLQLGTYLKIARY